MPTFTSVVVLLLLVHDVTAAVSPLEATKATLGEQDRDEGDGPSQDERLSRLESLLAEQADRLSMQESLLSLQTDQLSCQNDQLSRQSDQLSLQARLLAAQAEKLSHQEGKIQDQSEELSSLKELFQDQSKEMSTLKTLVQSQFKELSSFKALAPVQSEKLSFLKVLFPGQSDQVKDQGGILSGQGQGIQHLTFNVHNLDKKDDQQSTGLTNSSTQPDQHQRDDHTWSTPGQSHHIASRSDDSDPLETVVQQMGQRMTELAAEVQLLHNSNTEARTSTFVRWGHSQCPASSQLVYSGVVGGSLYSHPGAATNPLCLTMDPVFSQQPVPSAMAYLYGAEYETQDSHMDRDVVCSVCRSDLSSTIMVPATNVCPSGWQRQYRGFLMAGFYNHAAGSEFICVDDEEEGRPGTGANNDGKLLYYTVAQCGSLPCDPYVANKIVTCVVCSL